MARAPRDDDDDAPWLAEGVREAPATLVPRARLVGGTLVAVLLAVLVGLGVYLASGHKSDGSAGYARPEDAPLIAADAGPYKLSPTDPGGAQITGIDDSVATVASGADTGSALAPDAAEEPLARPGLTPSGVTTAPPAAAPTAPAAPPTDLLPATIPPAPHATVPPPLAAPPPARTIAPAPVVAPKPATPAAAAATAKPTPKPDAPTRADAPKPAKAKPATTGDTDPLAAVAAGLPADAPVRAAKPKADAVTKSAEPKPDTAGAAPKGGVTLQLGAFSTRDKADAAWATAGGDGALAGLSKRIEPVDRAGTMLYRLRAAGVASKDAARALCARIRAAGNACIVAE